MKRYRNADEEEDNECEVWQCKQRVYFHAPVTKTSIALLIRCLADAEDYVCQHRLPEIDLFIHTMGGDLYAGLSGMDHIATMHTPVHTVADGIVASSGTFLLLGGARRSGLRNSSVLIHQMRTGFWGKYNELCEEVSNSTMMMQLMRDVYRQKTSLSEDMIETLFQSERLLSGRQAEEHGIVQNLI